MSNEFAQFVEELDSGLDSDFLEAAMGASALVAWADQDISLNELSARDFCLANVSKFKAFNPDEAADRFTYYVELLRHDFEPGKAQILDTVAVLSGDEQAKQLIISIGISIGKSDYTFKPAEQAVINQLCEVLGVKPIAVMTSFKSLEDHRVSPSVDQLTGSSRIGAEPQGWYKLDTWAKTLNAEQSEAFLQAAMGASALMAWADQEITSHETSARDFCLSTVNRLKTFDPKEAADIFTHFIEALRSHSQQAKTEILEAVAQFTEDEQARMLIISIAVAIAKSDYDFSPKEETILHELCEVLRMTKVEAINSFRNPENPPNLDPLTGSALP
jgi:tellurite resistance protein TerB